MEDNKILKFKENVKELIDNYKESYEGDIYNGQVYISIKDEKMLNELNKKFEKNIIEDLSSLKSMVKHFDDNWGINIENKDENLVDDNDVLDDFYIELFDYALKDNQTILMLGFCDYDLQKDENTTKEFFDFIDNYNQGDFNILYFGLES